MKTKLSDGALLFSILPGVPDKPPKLLKMAANLFADEAEQEAFTDSVLKTQPYRPALVWLDERPEEAPFRVEESQLWQPDFVDRLKRDQRPGQNPLHEGGSYYCMNLASVFEGAVFTAVADNPRLVIDLCAAPGGKSVLAWRTLKPRMLISNEVIRKRAGQLIANLRRCHIHPAKVTSLDTSVIAASCPGAADLVIVDAPCSGQSLIAKGKHVSASFHSHVINHNRNRQRRILGNAAEVVRPGGWLAYITCTYAVKENEGNVKWFLKNFPNFSPVAVERLKGWESHLADFPCYRLWPHHGAGPGGFTALLQRDAEGEVDEEGFGSDALLSIWGSDQ